MCRAVASHPLQGVGPRAAGLRLLLVAARRKGAEGLLSEELRRGPAAHDHGRRAVLLERRPAVGREVSVEHGCVPGTQRAAVPQVLAACLS